jgi:hypothetical protein
MQLRRLDLALGSSTAPQVNAAFDSISRLPQLVMLFISFKLSDEVSWDSLRRCSTLRSLELRWNPKQECTTEQLDVLRAMPHLLVFRMPNSLDSSDLCHLLRPPLPQPLQLQQLPSLEIDDTGAAALVGLPLLRVLSLQSVGLTDYSFLRRLPHLNSLTLDASLASAQETELLLPAALAGQFAHISRVRIEPN